MDEIIKYGTVRRGTLRGIQLQQMSPQLARELGAADARGALIWRIDPRSDGYRAGLRQYDIVVRFNNSEIDEPSQFIRMLADAEIGSRATLTVVREGRQRTITVVVEQASGTRTRV
jgi:serine protease Do